MSMPYFGHPRAGPAPEPNSTNVTLKIRQQPEQALVTLNKKEKNRKPIDPPPIVQMLVNDSGVDSSWLVSPYFFLIATLVDIDNGNLLVGEKYIIGTSSSSLHRLKDITNRDGGFFVFSDLSVRQVGIYRLRFSLFNQLKDDKNVEYLCSVDSDPFKVTIGKDFPGLNESSHLSRTFSDQGVRLRLRKENKLSGKKRRRGSSDDSPSTNNAYGVAVGANYWPQAGPAPKRQRIESDTQGPYSMYGHMPNVGYQYAGNTLASNGHGSYPSTQAYDTGSHLDAHVLGGYQGEAHSSSNPMISGPRHGGQTIASAPPTASWGTPIKAEPLPPDPYSHSGYATPGGQYGTQQSQTLSGPELYRQRVTSQQQSYLPQQDSFSENAPSSFPSDSHAQHQESYNTMDPTLQRSASVATTQHGLAAPLANTASYPQFNGADAYGSGSLPYHTPESVTGPGGLPTSALTISTLNSAYPSQYNNDFPSATPSGAHVSDLSNQAHSDPGPSYAYLPLGTLSGP